MPIVIIIFGIILSVINRLENPKAKTFFQDVYDSESPTLVILIIMSAFAPIILPICLFYIIIAILFYLFDRSTDNLINYIVNYINKRKNVNE